MSFWHVVLLIIVGYVIAMFFPGPGNAVRGLIAG